LKNFFDELFPKSNELDEEGDSEVLGTFVKNKCLYLKIKNIMI
jgi:hypothetical protein